MCYECDDKFSFWNKRYHCHTCGKVFCIRCIKEDGEGEGKKGVRYACNYCLLNRQRAAEQARSPSSAGRRSGLSSPRAPSAAPRQSPLARASTGDLAGRKGAMTFRKGVTSVVNLARFTRDGLKFEQEEPPAAPRGEGPEERGEGGRGGVGNGVDRTLDSIVSPSYTSTSDESILARMEWKGTRGDALTRDKHEKRNAAQTLEVELNRARAERQADGPPGEDPVWDIPPSPLRPSPPDPGAADGAGAGAGPIWRGVAASAAAEANGVPIGPGAGRRRAAPKTEVEALGAAAAQFEGASPTPGTPLARIEASKTSAEEVARSDERYAAILRDLCSKHLGAFTLALLEQAALDAAVWGDVVQKLGYQAALRLADPAITAELMDPSQFIKVKRIANGEPLDSELFDGVIFSKNVSNRRMRTDIADPKVVLLAGAIEYQRTEGRLSSLDTLQSQEEEHLRIQVARIIYQKPDVLFVEKSVARYAQELLLDEGVSLVQNVKPRVLDRLARICRVVIAAGAHEITEEYVGRCDAFFTKTFTGLRQGASPLRGRRPPRQAPPQNGSSPPRRARGSKTLMFLRRQGSGKGCTLVLRGADLATLTKVKHVVQMVSTAAHNGRMETAFLVNMFSSVQLSPSANVREIVEERLVAHYGRGAEKTLSLSPFVWKDVPPAPVEPEAEMLQTYVSVSSRCPSKGLLCEPLTVHRVGHYTESDFTLERFLQAALPDPEKFCPHEECGLSPQHHVRVYVHGCTQFTLKVNIAQEEAVSRSLQDSIWTWATCKICGQTHGPSDAAYRVQLSERARGLSLGRFFTLMFSGEDILAPCGHRLFLDFRRWFSLGNGIAMLDAKPIRPYALALPTKFDQYNDRLLGQWLKRETQDISLDVTETMGTLVGSIEYLMNHVFKMANDASVRDEADGAADVSPEAMKAAASELMQMKSDLVKEEQEILASMNLMTGGEALSVVGLCANAAPPSASLEGVLTSYQVNEVRMWLNRLIAQTHRHLLDITGAMDAKAGKKKWLDKVISNPSLSEKAPGAHTRHLSMRSGDFTEKGLLLDLSAVDAEAAKKRPAGRPTHSRSSSAGSLIFENMPDWFFKSEPGPPRELAHAPGEKRLTRQPSMEGSYRRSQQQLSKSGHEIHLPLNAGTVRIHGRFVDGVQLRAGCALIYEDEPTSLIACMMLMTEYAKFLKNARANILLRSLAFNVKPEQSPGHNATAILLSPEAEHVCVDFEGEPWFNGLSDKFAVTAYYPAQFEELRALFDIKESVYVHSLSRCMHWESKGGKSQAYFAKTQDGKYVIKQLSKTELSSFLAFAPKYFAHLQATAEGKNTPSCLAKIYGVYQVSMKGSQGQNQKDWRLDIVVSEDVFYDRDVSTIYDLKGSIRSRLNPDPSNANPVLLDENLLKAHAATPLFMEQLQQSRLDLAIWADTNFLSNLNVMDYSLLVGVDNTRRELVVGIIDYLRQYTWDKQVESWVKNSGLLGGKGKVPTIISPTLYKKRFRVAMTMYFPLVPTCSDPPETMDPDEEEDVDAR